MFQILENDLVNFLNYVPMDYYFSDERKKIYSPKLAELLIRIGSQVDNFFRYYDPVHDVFKKLYPKKKFNIDKFNIENYRDIERDGKIILSNKEIIILSTEEIIKPFEFWTDNRFPLWWNAYNKVKHQGFENKKEGNLFNVIESLSALFLLNCINENTKNKLIEYGFYELSNKEYRDLKRDKIWFIPRSPARSQLFEYKNKPNTVDLRKYKKK